jgi:hypothetical protein
LVAFFARGGGKVVKDQPELLLYFVLCLGVFWVLLDVVRGFMKPIVKITRVSASREGVYKTQGWQFRDMSSFSLASTSVGEESVRLLLFNMKDGQRFDVEISDDVSDDAILQAIAPKVAQVEPY